MDTVKLKIIDVAYRGKGVARIEGMVVFVPGVLLGETVTARIETKKKRYATARLLDVVEPSAHRRDPICPLARRPAAGGAETCQAVCPGCAYQHVAYGEEVRLKQAQLASLLSRQAGVDAGVLLAPVAAPLDMGYRNKIVLHAGARGGRATLGYVGEDNASLVDVPRCPLAVDPINALLAETRDRFAGRPPKAGSLTLRHTSTDGALCLETAPADLPEHLTESTVLGPVLVPTRSFFQINPGVADEVVSRIMALLTELAPRRVVDLYCGCGIFALTAGRAGVAETIGIDRDGPAIGAARLNASRLGLDRTVHFRAGTADTEFEQAIGGGGGTVLIVDPPRSGLGKDTVARIARVRPDAFIYVSCAADTLTRDLAQLTAEGYRVDNVQLFDMFPRTALFESVTLLRRASPGD